MNRLEFEKLELQVQQSGLPLKSYLQQIGVSYSTYHYWRRKCSVDRNSIKQELAPISFKQSVMESSPVFRDIIDDGQTGFIVSNNDMKSFVNKCLFLIDNPKARIEMSKHCLTKAKSFTIDKTIGLWENIIN